jgi:hypothetical protein
MGWRLAPIYRNPRCSNLKDAPMDIDAFLNAYIECALWSTSDASSDDVYGPQTLDARYGPEDIAPDTLAAMRADCAKFIAEHQADLGATGAAPDECGHDFWLTREGHGSGFWDRGYGAAGERLTSASRAYGGFCLYVGYDGLIHHAE